MMNGPIRKEIWLCLSSLAMLRLILTCRRTM
jgi:hypothetical protein